MDKTVLQQKIKKFLLPAIAVIAIILAVYFYIRVNKLEQNPQEAAQQETKELVAKISKLIVLPADEVPTVATVSDPEVLKDQPFFISAQKGDKVLIYSQAKKAILYSVSLNKILEVAPLNVGAQKSFTPPTAEVTPAPAPAPTPTKNPTKKR